MSLRDLDDEIVRNLIRAGVMKEMTAAELLAVPGPTQVSNRTIYDRCLAWGCKITRTNGNWVWLTSPFGAKFKVRPPQQHEANGKPIIDGMLEALVLPWSVFIAAEITDVQRIKQIGEGFQASPHSQARPGDVMGPCSICENDVIRAVMVKSGKKIAHPWCVARQKEEQERQQPASPPPSQEESDTVPPDTLEVVYTPEADTLSVTTSPDEPRRASGIINRVFDLLVERGDSMSNQAVAEQLDITQQQATSALAGLCNQGVITRVKAGVYQAKPHVTRRSGNFGLVVSGDGQIDHEPSAVVQQALSRRVQQGPPVTVGVNWLSQYDEQLVPDANEDETINEILDLIAPHGFKARHLPLIDSFKRSALALMREVNRG